MPEFKQYNKVMESNGKACQDVRASSRRAVLPTAYPGLSTA